MNAAKLNICANYVREHDSYPTVYVYLGTNPPMSASFFYPVNIKFRIIFDLNKKTKVFILLTLQIVLHPLSQSLRLQRHTNLIQFLKYFYIYQCINSGPIIHFLG